MIKMDDSGVGWPVESFRFVGRQRRQEGALTSGEKAEQRVNSMALRTLHLRVVPTLENQNHLLTNVRLAKMLSERKFTFLC